MSRKCPPRPTRERWRSANGAKCARPYFPYGQDCANPNRPRRLAAPEGVNFRAFDTCDRPKINSFFLSAGDTSAAFSRMCICAPDKVNSAVGFCSYFGSIDEPKMLHANWSANCGRKNKRYEAHYFQKHPPYDPFIFYEQIYLIFGQKHPYRLKFPQLLGSPYLISNADPPVSLASQVKQSPQPPISLTSPVSLIPL